MTDEEARVVINAILEGGGYADRDVADKIIARLIMDLPGTKWGELVILIDNELDQ